MSFQKQINWSSNDKYDQFNKLARQRIYEGVTKYISGGLRALGSYTDREQPFDLYENMKSMLDSSYLRQDKSGGIYQHVLDYPDGRVPEATDFYYWEDIDFGEGPTIRVNRVSMFPNGVGVFKYVVTNEQLYASRNIRIALQVFYCVPDTLNPEKPGFLLDRDERFAGSRVRQPKTQCGPQNCDRKGRRVNPRYFKPLPGKTHRKVKNCEFKRLARLSACERPRDCRLAVSSITTVHACDHISKDPPVLQKD
jgi:hypothetical protein